MGLPDTYPCDAIKLPTTAFTGGWDIMGLISGTSPDFFAWHKWKLSWLDDTQVSCIATPSVSRHILAPLGTHGGTKLLAVKLNDTAVLAVELRTRQGLDGDACSEGLLFYIVNVARGSGYGPIHVLDPREATGGGKSKPGCNLWKGGPLTSAAMDFTRGEGRIQLQQYGVGVQVDGMRNGEYMLTVSYNGDQSVGRPQVIGWDAPQPNDDWQRDWQRFGQAPYNRH
jgi:hypothetical protein